MALARRRLLDNSLLQSPTPPVAQARSRMPSQPRPTTPAVGAQPQRRRPPVPPEDEPETPPTTPPPPAETPTLRSILSKYKYGPQGLYDAREELGKLGYNLQMHTEGYQGRTGARRVRGRVIGPDGNVIQVLDPRGESQNWWDNLQGSEWGYTDIGPEGTSESGSIYEDIGEDEDDDDESTSAVDRINAMLGLQASEDNPILAGIGGFDATDPLDETDIGEPEMPPVPDADLPNVGGLPPSIEEIIRQIITRRGRTGSPLEESAEKTLKRIIDEDGGINSERLGRRVTGARERLEKARRSQTEQAQAELASRGLLSTPGIVQGSELQTLGNIGEGFAEEFGTAMRDIEVAESQAADERLMSALGLATGMSRDQAQTMLGAIGAENQRQAVLAQIAIEQLKNNTTWNMFLAQYGLDRDRLLLEIANGRMDQIIPILTAFLASINASRGGSA
jgi:hypothetical protein